MKTKNLLAMVLAFVMFASSIIAVNAADSRYAFDERQRMLVVDWLEWFAFERYIDR